MKKSIILTLILIISYASIGQRKVTLLNSDTALLETHYIESYLDSTKAKYLKCALGTDNMLEKYKRVLTSRQKVISDSLEKKGVTEFLDIVLNMYAREIKGTKTKKYWQKRGDAIFILNYEIYNTKKGHGFRLINETEIK